MLVKQFPSSHDIIDSLKIHYGIAVIRLSFLPLGADQHASVYKAETQDHSSYFIKIKRGRHHGLNTVIVELLHNAGIQQIIPPVRTIHSQLTQGIDDFTLMVYPFIEGQSGFSHSLTDKQWQILGKTLRQVHEIAVPASIQPLIRREAYSPKWREIIRSLYTRIETEPTSDEIALNLSGFMKKNTIAIHRLVDRAEQLVQNLQNESPQFVLCHSDIHGGNVLMDGNTTIYLVDWDEPIMAPKERDLMFIGGGVGNVWNKPQEEALFYKGYGKTTVNKIILAYYRHERIVEDIALYGQDLLLTTAGGAKRLERYKHFIAMFEPRGVVDIAFETDE